MRGLNHPRYGGEPDPYETEKATVLSLSEESVPISEPDDELDDVEDVLKQVIPETGRGKAPRIRTLVFRDLHPAAMGNAIGIGHADLVRSGWQRKRTVSP